MRGINWKDPKIYIFPFLYTLGMYTGLDSGVSFKDDQTLAIGYLVMTACVAFLIMLAVQFVIRTVTRTFRKDKFHV